MTAIIIALVTFGLLAHILWVVFTDDPTRHRGWHEPPRSHPADDLTDHAARDAHRDLAA